MSEDGQARTDGQTVAGISIMTVRNGCVIGVAVRAMKREDIGENVYGYFFFIFNRCSEGGILD